MVEGNSKIAIISSIALFILIISFIFIPMSYSADTIFFNNQSGPGETTECINLGSQYQIVLNSTSGDCFIRSLANGTGIILSANSTHITINSTASGGESTVCSNLGSVGEGIVSSSSNGNCDFKKLLAGTGISLSSNSTHIILTNSLPESTVCTNVGSGSNVYKDGNCNFRSLLGSPDISVTQQSDTITIDFNGTGGSNHNLLSSTHSDTTIQTVSRGSLIYGDITPTWNELSIGTASKYLRSNGTDVNWSWNNVVTKSASVTLQLNEEVILCNVSSAIVTLTLPPAVGNTGKMYYIHQTAISNNCVIDGNGAETINGLTTFTLFKIGDSIAIESDGSNWIILADRLSVGQIIGQVYAQLTKTNIGTTYIDIYTTAFHEENMMRLDCRSNAISQFRIFYLWNVVGTGDQTLRWVDVSAPSNGLFETGIIADSDAGDTGWFDKPDWCISSNVGIEWQGKSTTAGDDPIAYGYKILVR